MGRAACSGWDGWALESGTLYQRHGGARRLFTSDRCARSLADGVSGARQPAQLSGRTVRFGVHRTINTPTPALIRPPPPQLLRVRIACARVAFSRSAPIPPITPSPFGVFVSSAAAQSAPGWAATARRRTVLLCWVRGDAGERALKHGKLKTAHKCATYARTPGECGKKMCT